MLTSRALEVWGSWGALETEQQKRQMEFDAMERRRKFLSELLGNLKKNSKDFNRKYQDQEVGVVIWGDWVRLSSQLTGAVSTVFS